MRARVLHQLHELVVLLNHVMVALALVALFASVWAPGLYDATEVELHAKGRVVSTSELSIPVVELENGEHLALESIQGEVGDEVTIYRSALAGAGVDDDPTSGVVLASVITFTVSLVVAVVLCVGGCFLLRFLERRLHRAYLKASEPRVP